MAKNNNNNSGDNKLGLALGALAALTAGAYYLYGTRDGAKRRENIKGWTLRAKGEVLEKLENLKDVNQDSYNALVDNVVKKYRAVKSVDKEELDELVDDLKRHWKNIKRGMDEASNPEKKTVKRTVKKAVKKILDK